MTIESIELTPQSDQKPTFVPLFRYGPKGLEACRAEHSALSLFVKEDETSILAWEKKREETGKLVNRLYQSQQDTTIQLNSLTSSVTTGLAFLKFLDIFIPQGLTKPEVLKFFNSCLYINYILLDGSASDSETLTKQAIAGFDSKKAKPVLSKMARSIPDWFHEGPQQYQELISYYSSFRTLFNPEFTQEQRIKSSLEMKNALKEGKDADIPFLGYVEKDGIPDWLSEDVYDPDPIVVQDELIADKKDLELLKQEALRISKQLIYLEQSLKDKAIKLDDWWDRRWNEVRIENPCLGDFLSFLHIKAKALDINDSIKYFVDLKDRELDAETLALWIEDNFTKAGIVKKGEITENGEDILNIFLEATVKQDSQQIAAFRSLKETNKRGYNTLNFNLGPFIELLEQEDVDLLHQFLDAEQINESGPIISFLADIISQRLRNQKDAPVNPKLTTPLKEYREFLKKFLRQNWAKLYQEYSDILFPSQDTKPEEISEIRNQTYEYPNNLLSELENEVTQAEKGHLKGWTILYSPNQTIDEASLIEVAGDTLHDKAKFLQTLFVRLGISNSIKPDSITNSVDWKTQVPKEIEQLVPGMMVKGEWWKKMKRQKVRILYRMSPEDKKFIFFVYQKKDWSYNLAS